MKIDILDDYIRSSERFRVIRIFFGVPESYGNSPGSICALLGHTGIEERGRKEGGTQPPSGPNWTRGAAPFSFLLSPSFPPSPTPTRKEGVLLPVGVGLPLARPLLGRPHLPPPSFIYGGRGAPHDTQVDLRDRSLAVCGAPLHDITPRSYCSGA